jgi:hypothetical protein
MLWGREQDTVMVEEVETGRGREAEAVLPTVRVMVVSPLPRQVRE